MLAAYGGTMYQGSINSQKSALQGSSMHDFSLYDFIIFISSKHFSVIVS